MVHKPDGASNYELLYTLDAKGNKKAIELMLQVPNRDRNRPTGFEVVVSGTSTGSDLVVSEMEVATDENPAPENACSNVGISKKACKRLSRQSAGTQGFPGCIYSSSSNPLYVRKFSRKKCRKLGAQSKQACKALNAARCPGGEEDATCLNRRVGCQLATTCPYKLKKECKLFPTACQWVAGSKKVAKMGCQPL